MSFRPSDGLSRRAFLAETAGLAAAGTGLGARSPRRREEAESLSAIPLGAPVFADHETPDEWIAVLQRQGYGAAYCPVGPDADAETVSAYEQAAAEAGIVIAEVGAWSNPISPNAEEREAAIEKCRRRLHLADRIGARCCVNISGSRNPDDWAGPHEDNLTPDTFDLIVETTRSIIDDVQPRRTYFTLETMPWAYPDTPENYLRLIKAIDRDRFAVHCDPVNIITSPQRYYGNGDLIERFFSLLGPYIKSCHGKDIALANELTTHLSETRPGTGGLDYRTFLRELAQLKDVPLMLEHLEGAAAYRQAADYVRREARAIGLD